MPMVSESADSQRDELAASALLDGEKYGRGSLIRDDGGEFRGCNCARRGEACRVLIPYEVQ